MTEHETIQDVNIELGNSVSNILYEASKLTYGNRPGLAVEFHESFSGLRAMRTSYFNGAGDCLFNLAFDGVGTKVEIAERMEDHSGVAFDLFAMVCDDAVVRGAEPVAAGSILDVRRLNNNEFTCQAIAGLAKGYVNAAKAAGVVVINGEVAELGRRVDGYARYKGSRWAILSALGSLVSPKIADRHERNRFNYNWGAGVLWFANEERVLSGHEIQPGHKLVGLVERGFRSNGITDVRKAMQKEYGPAWHEQIVPELGNIALGKIAQTPSTIYCKLINDITGGYDIRKAPKASVSGVAHITGGGQPGKLGRMLEPSGYGALIDDPIEPPAIMIHAQKLRGFSDETAYGKWHMGPGMVVATSDPEKVIEVARKHRIEAKQIGEITEEPGIRIKSLGIEKPGELLHF